MKINTREELDERCQKVYWDVLDARDEDDVADYVKQLLRNYTKSIVPEAVGDEAYEFTPYYSLFYL